MTPLDDSSRYVPFHIGITCFLNALIVATLATAPAQGAPEGRWELTSGDSRVEVTSDAQGVWITAISAGKEEPKRNLRSPVVILETSLDQQGEAGFLLLGVEAQTTPQGDPSLRIRQEHRASGVVVELVLSGIGETSVYTSEIEIANPTDHVVEVTRSASFALIWPKSAALLRSIREAGGNEFAMQEKSLADEPLEIGTKDRGRSSRTYFPWCSLYLESLDVSVATTLAYSGNWLARYAPASQGGPSFELGMQFDNDGVLRLAPGSRIALPRAAFSVTAGQQLNRIVHAHHAYLRQRVLPLHPANKPLLVEYNTWYSHDDSINEALVLEAIPYAQRVGCELFVVDANWHYCPGNPSDRWYERLGDWEVDPRRFPNGLSPIIERVRQANMKFGIWFEPEVASVDSNVAREHPEWFLTLDGERIVTKNRYHLDYGIPEVREWMLAKIERVMEEGPIDWIKLDYNLDIGGQFDPPAGEEMASNTRLHRHLMGYYQFLEALAQKYPHVIIENCSSGARRTDPGILQRCHANWVSDATHPKGTAQIAWGALALYPPESCNHWMTGDASPNRRGGQGKIESNEPEWWDFMFHMAMTGQYGYSARFEQWPEEALERAASNTRLYKQIREVLYGARVDHLTPQPAPGNNPTGWMAIQYTTPDLSRSVVRTFRFADSPAAKRLKLQQLDPEGRYQLHRNGLPGEEFRGRELMEQGVEVEFDQEWRSQVLDFHRLP